MKTKKNEQANPPKMPKLDWSALKKVFGYLKHYKWGLALVVVCILLNAVAGAASSLFLQTLIDKYILPMVGLENPEFAGLILLALRQFGFIAELWSQSHKAL